MSSGIIHVLKSGGCWVDAPDVYGPPKTLYNRFVRWAAKGIWVRLFQALAQAGGPPAHVLMDSFAVKAHARRQAAKGGAEPGHRALARGRSTKINALTGRHCRPIAVTLTGGQVADCKAADALRDVEELLALLRGLLQSWPGLGIRPRAGGRRIAALIRASLSNAFQPD